MPIKDFTSHRTCTALFDSLVGFDCTFNLSNYQVFLYHCRFISLLLLMVSFLHLWVPFLSFIKMVIVLLFCFDWHLTGIVTEPNLGLLTRHETKMIYWYRVVVKEITVYVARCPTWGQARGMGSSSSKLPNSSVAFRKGFLFLYKQFDFFFFKGIPLFLLFIYLFYFWLCWVFVSVQGLSLVAASGGHSSSRCVGLSPSQPLLLRGAQAPDAQAQ